MEELSSVQSGTVRGEPLNIININITIKQMFNSNWSWKWYYSLKSNQLPQGFKKSQKNRLLRTVKSWQMFV